MDDTKKPDEECSHCGSDTHGPENCPYTQGGTEQEQDEKLRDMQRKKAAEKGQPYLGL